MGFRTETCHGAGNYFKSKLNVKFELNPALASSRGVSESCEGPQII